MAYQVSIEHRFKRVVAEQLGLDVDAVQGESSFVNDLGADSLDLVEIVMGAEEEFGIEVPDADAESWLVIRDAVKYLEGVVGRD